MKKQIVVGCATLGLAVLTYVAIPLTSNAQAPAKESLEQKVVRLENEVSELKKEIAALKRARSVMTLSPNYSQSLPALVNPAKPLPGTPFGFNGQTYYKMPLNEKGNSAIQVQNTPITTANPVLISPK